MKKFFALALALVLTFAMAVTCFAAVEKINAADGTKSKDIAVKYVGSDPSGDVYGVDVEFGAMEFTYIDAVQGQWDPDTHTYLESAEAKWTVAGNTVKVTNHSNVAIDVTVSYADAADYEGGVEFDVDNGIFTLAAGVVDAYADADADIATVTVGGTATAADAALAKIGTVTVSIAKAAQ